MSDQSAPLDFDFDVQSVDTSRPELSVGDHVMQITKIERKPWTKTPENSSLVIELCTVDATRSSKGDQLSPGFRSNFRVNLQNNLDDSGNPIGDFLRDLALFSIAVTGQQQRINAEFVSSAIGAKVIAVVKAKKKPDDFGENEIKSLKQFIA